VLTNLRFGSCFVITIKDLLGKYVVVGLPTCTARSLPIETIAILAVPEPAEQKKESNGCPAPFGATFGALSNTPIYLITSECYM
jgi:hypothetical protein